MDMVHRGARAAPSAALLDVNRGFDRSVRSAGQGWMDSQGAPGRSAPLS